LKTIILDAMGGDDYPEQNLNGAKLAVESLPIKVILVGNKTLLEQHIKKIKNWPSKKISIHHAEDVVTMEDSPSKSFRLKKDSSIQVGLKLVKENNGDAFVSAGNTGAILAASTFILGRCEGIERPTLASIFPSEKKHFVMLDMGSNVDCKASHLAQFAIMGSLFAKSILEVSNPKVGLLNIGEEKDKGNALTQQTYELLSNSNLNFIGNVEGKDLPKGNVDIVVCDGFTGNIVLKFAEGLVSMFKNLLKDESKKSPLTLLALMLLKPAFKKHKKKFDKDEYGGAPLLGVNGIAIISHGSSSQNAIKNAIKTAFSLSKNNLIENISNNIKNSKKTEPIKQPK
tara:strand:+ start:3561 stop:4586 length:1026 start_codon:yes stop_codon:yes gene_type:complete